jgi:hypothetical protein
MTIINIILISRRCPYPGLIFNYCNLTSCQLCKVEYILYVIINLKSTIFVIQYAGGSIVDVVAHGKMWGLNGNT